VKDLPAGVRKALPASTPPAAPAESEATQPEHDAEKARARRQRPSRDELEGLLRKHHGDIPDLARAFGRHREQVWRWCKDYELNPERFRA
jgi:hypothetical protein